MPQSGIREIFDKAQNYENLYNLSIGEPDFVTPEPIAAAVRDQLGNGIGSYTQTIGREDLRTDLARKLAAQNGIDVDPEKELLVTPGAMGALFVAVNVLCDPGDEVLIPSPHWPNYEGHLVSAGAKIIPIPTTKATGFIPRANQIEDSITDDTVGMILNTPANPTGAVFPPGKLKEIGDVLKDKNFWCILDETYEDLTYGSSEHYSLASQEGIFDKCLTIHSFSKSYAMTGWRLGYASGPQNVISAMRVLQEHTISCAAEPSQIAAKAALNSRNLTEDIREIFSNRRNIILDRLESIDGIQPGAPAGAFYVFADVSDITTSSRDLVDYLLDSAHVAAVPGSVFGDAGEGFLRFSYATDEETIATAMNQLEHAFQEY